jgi:hypothetical protein
MKTILLTSFLFAIALVSSHTTFACSCCMPTVREAFNKSKLVFVGTVVAIESDGVKFKVNQSWKGVSSTVVKVFVRHLGTSCDPGVAKGRSLLVYAYPGGSRLPLLAAYCGRTRVLTERDDETKELDALRSSAGATPNKSLDASGTSGPLIDKLSVAQLLAAASTQPLCVFFS